MSEEQRRTTLDSPVSSDMAGFVTRELKSHDGRMVIKEVVAEHIASSAFAERVKKIQLEVLESTETYKKIEDKVQNQIDKTLSLRGLRQRNFIVPTVIGSVGILIAVVSAVVAIIALN